MKFNIKHVFVGLFGLAMAAALLVIMSERESNAGQNINQPYLEGETPQPADFSDSIYRIQFTNPDGTTVGPLTVAMAANDRMRERGLMFVSEMPQNQGMLFIWNEAEQRFFWMKNTFIPLDILFIQDYTLVGAFKNARPLDETMITVPQPANMVLEINAGLIEQLGIQLGAKLNITRRH